jgi:hypothetical protein
MSKEKFKRALNAILKIIDEHYNKNNSENIFSKQGITFTKKNDDFVSEFSYVIDNGKVIDFLKSTIPANPEFIKHLNALDLLIRDINKKANEISDTPSIDWHEFAIIRLYARFLKAKESFNTSLKEYVNYICELAYSEYYYYQFFAPLVGVSSAMQILKIEDFVIRKLTDNEKISILNAMYASNIGFISRHSEIIVGTYPRLNNELWMFYTTKRKQPRKGIDLRWMFVKSYGYEPEDFIDPEIVNLILTFRLYDNSYVGIRTVFERRSFDYNNIELESMWEKLFLAGEFGYKWGRELEIDDKNLIAITSIYRKIKLVKNKNIIQINRALEYYFRAYQHTPEILKFTELIMSFESLLNNNEIRKSSKLSDCISLYCLSASVKLK